jgi:hypothetical protein
MWLEGPNHVWISGWVHEGHEGWPLTVVGTMAGIEEMQAVSGLYTNTIF